MQDSAHVKFSESPGTELDTVEDIKMKKHSFWPPSRTYFLLAGPSLRAMTLESQGLSLDYYLCCIPAMRPWIFHLFEPPFLYLWTEDNNNQKDRPWSLQMSEPHEMISEKCLRFKDTENSAYYYSPSVPFPQNVLNSTPSSLVLGLFMRANCRKATDHQDKLGRRLGAYLFILSSFQ